MRRFSSTVYAIATLILVTALFLGGCKTQTTTSLFTEAEKSDRDYVRKLLKNSHYAELDMSDPPQNRYYTRQMSLAGFTAEKFPRIFKAIDDARDRHTALRSKLGSQWAPDRMALLTPVSSYSDRKQAAANVSGCQVYGQIVPGVYVTHVGPVDPSGLTFTSTVTVSVPTTANWAPSVTTSAIALTDQNGNLIGTPNGASDQEAGFDLENSVVGTATTAPTAVTAAGAYGFIDDQGCPHQGAFSVTSTIGSTNIAAGPAAQTVITNTAPTDTNNNGIIKVCIVRQDSDCDYFYAATNGQFVVKFPIIGNVVFPSTLQPLTFQQQSGQINITLSQPNTGQGGVCSMPANFNFWAAPTSVSGSTISWSFNPGPFSNPTSAPNSPCFPANSTVIYNLMLTVWGTNNSSYYASITTAQISPPPPNTKVIFPMVVQFGCIAEGSLVAMEDGSTKRIEQVDAGDVVRSAGTAPALEVSSFTTGFERPPMYRIVTDNGHRLLLTETHPVITPSGPRMARDLAAGDVVITTSGPARLTRVSPEYFHGGVRNLKLGASAASFFANGILVGDANAQQQIELAYRAQRANLLRSSILPEWQTDFKSSLEMMKRQQRPLSDR